jgi:hypothetical protein
MGYKCIGCGREISGDCKVCPQCGKDDAGFCAEREYLKNDGVYVNAHRGITSYGEKIKTFPHAILYMLFNLILCVFLSFLIVYIPLWLLTKIVKSMLGEP